jgi:hypothetical protein
MEQPSPSNERLSSISLVNVDDFHTNCQEMTTPMVASDKIILLIIIIRKGFNVSSSGQKKYINHGEEVPYSLRALNYI